MMVEKCAQIFAINLCDKKGQASSNRTGQTK